MLPRARREEVSVEVADELGGIWMFLRLRADVQKEVRGGSPNRPKLPQEPHSGPLSPLEGPVK